MGYLWRWQVKFRKSWDLFCTETLMKLMHVRVICKKKQPKESGDSPSPHATWATKITTKDGAVFAESGNLRSIRSLDVWQLLRCLGHRITLANVAGKILNFQIQESNDLKKKYFTSYFDVSGSILHFFWGLSKMMGIPQFMAMLIHSTLW